MNTFTCATDFWSVCTLGEEIAGLRKRADHEDMSVALKEHVVQRVVTVCAFVEL